MQVASNDVIFAVLSLYQITLSMIVPSLPAAVETMELILHPSFLFVQT